MAKLEKNGLEWSVFALSALLVVCLLGFLGYRTATADTRPPEIDIRVGRADARGDRYYLPLELENRGGTSVEGVRVLVTLARNGEADELGELQIAFLPHHSKRRGEVTFTVNPAEADNITARVLGYERPH